MLTRYLTRRGYDVIMISTKPGKSAVEITENGKRILKSSMWKPFMSKLRIQPTHMFFFSSLQTLLSLDADVVHSFFYYDSIAATCAKRRKNYKTVLEMHGVPIPGACYRRFPPERWLIREAIRRADCRIACSHFVSNLVSEYYGVDSQIMQPLGLDISEWDLGSGPPNGRPTFLAVADFDVRRKGVRALVQAFKLVKSKVPSALLRLSGNMSPQIKNEVLSGLPESIRSDIECLGLGKVEDVPRLYREASLMVLASMWEASGNVLLESWASGTPVVATNHGGLPEFMGDGVGVLFDPKTNAEETMNADGLAEAMLEGLALSEMEGTRKRCRAHAERFSCQALGPSLEKVYAG